MSTELPRRKQLKRVCGRGGTRRNEAWNRAGRGLLIQGKCSEECSVALVGEADADGGGNATQASEMEERLYKVQWESGVNTPDRIFRRGAADAMMGPRLLARREAEFQEGLWS